jgi:transcription elongation GreA/GreB family factor
MNKRALIRKIIARLTEELQVYFRAANASRAEATHEQNKAEDKYDTRGLEASYLAMGQSKAADEAAQSVAQFTALVVRDFAPTEPVSLGALVTLEDKTRNYYFIGPRAGGTEVEHEGQTVMVITPQSPLGRQLMGRKQGDTLQLDLGGRRSSLRMVAVS